MRGKLQCTDKVSTKSILCEILNAFVTEHTGFHVSGSMRMLS